MSKGTELSADELSLPIKRTDGETLAERLTGNAYHNILPARYLQKDGDGNLVETQEELFERVGKNVALAEAVFAARNQGVELTATPDQLKPDHPRRDELAAEVFGAGVTAEDDVETELTEYNITKFDYETVVPELPDEVRDHVESVAAAFQESMERLSFMPNSPTLMNAGGELQQLSACFVMSPDDDLSDIHETAKDAAEVFQCLTADTTVAVEGDGLVSIAAVEPGDRIVQRDGDGYRTRPVVETHAYNDAPTRTLETETGLTITGTPNHRLLINGEWTELEEARAGDMISVRLGWIPGERPPVSLTSVASGPRWEDSRTVSNEAIAALYATGLSDYDIAKQLDSSPSTIQRRRADELGLPPNGRGGRKPGRTFDEATFAELYDAGYTDSEIATELGVTASTVGKHRRKQALETNGSAVRTVTQPDVLTVELAELLGLWIGDGSVHQDGIRFHVSREPVLERIDRYSRDLFDTGVDWTWSDGCYEAVIHSHEIKRWWLENFGDAKPSSATASVPEPILRADRAVVSGFIRGLFTADGTLSKDKYPRLYSASEPLVDGVVQLLLGIGIPANKWDWESNKDREYFSVAPVGAEGLTPFADRVGFIDERTEVMARSLEDSATQPTTVGSVDETTWEQPISSVVDAGEQTVYDLTVADEPEYVANGIVSHNSGGGVGYAFWQLRPYGDAVGSTGGIASGPITFMRTYDQLCETIAQGGTRRGAQMGIMRISHPDVIQFIHAKNKDVSLAETLRLNDPDDFTHTSFADALEEARELITEDGKVPEHLRNAVEGHLSNFNISVGVTDDFMEALKNDEEYTFINPRTEEPHIATPETKELYDMFELGEYVEVGEVLSVPAAEIWEHIIAGAHENGEPGVIYLERVNKEHSFDVEEHPDHRILATNPCVTGEMEVQLADGTTKPISSLAEGTERIDVKSLENDSVVVKPARAFKTKENARVVRITTESGVELRATPDHKIRADDGTWVEAQDLSAGDQIVGLSRLKATPHGSIQDTTAEVVAAVENDGRADVYDLNVEETHNFFASRSGEESINVHNCGEQPLEEYEACNLGHINLSTVAATDAPDWRVWSARNADEYATHEEAIEAFLAEAIDWEEFDRRIELGTRFLENVVTMSDFPVPEIEKTVREMRKIGLGIMGLAQLYIQLGIKYGSDEGNEVARQLMTHINHHSKWTSHELADERGVFAEWENSKYADPVRYREWFEHQTGLDADDWADGFAIRNHNTTTIAPTGTTSMVGNTTGGCEPIYNVAYYKNVSDDVQGDEMLVEFDDYFLRVLEDNDIDVEEVKEEAQSQMANNAFEGVESLTTVPNSISELFVTTGDLSAKAHAGVQTACQQGVDSAISKTVNAPNDSTLSDAKEVFEYIYDHGGKGVTYYRDGTRSKQVLTTRAQNTEFAQMDEAEALQFVIEQIEERFDGIESFLETEDVRERLSGDVAGLLATGEGQYAKKKPRPDQLHGVTQRIDTGYGKLYVTINEDPATGEPFELFANTGHSGGFTNSFTDALAKTISVALRSGVDPGEIVDKLHGIRSPKVAWDKGEQINSIPDAFGTALRRYLDDEIDRTYPDQATLDETAAAESGEADQSMERETDGGAAVTDASTAARTDSQSIVKAGENPECPECGSFTLYYSEGCKTCESCGWSEC